MSDTNHDVIDTSTGRVIRRSVREVEALEKLRAEVLADIVRIAGTIDTTRGMPFQRYRAAGGRYPAKSITKLGGWERLFNAVNIRSNNGGGDVQPKVGRVVQKSERTGRTRALIWQQVDAELNQMTGWRTPAKNSLRLVGTSRHGKGRHKAARRETPVLERGEIIADIREVSRSVGLLCPQLLTWSTYTDNGGRYRFDQLATLGGFTALRNAA